MKTTVSKSNFFVKHAWAFRIVSIISILVILFAACTPQQAPATTQVQPTKVFPTQTSMPEPTATTAPLPTDTPEPTAEPTQDPWTLEAIPVPASLPKDLAPAILYAAPADNCKDDLSATCNVPTGLVEGDFTIAAQSAFVVTGDAFNISADGKLLAKRTSLDSVHDLWLIFNTTNAPITLHQKSQFGHFQGVFSPLDTEWDVLEVTHLRNLSLERFTVDCKSDKCEAMNVFIAILDESGWHMTTTVYKTK